MFSPTKIKRCQSSPITGRLRGRPGLWPWALSLALLPVAAPALAGEEAPEKDEAAEAAEAEPEKVAPEVARARALYRQGVRLVKKTQWGDALAAFEKSYAARPHSQTTFNIGLCERAMSAYTRARATFKQALASHANGGGELSASVQAEARGYVDEIGRLLARVEVALDNPAARIAVDGRPLTRSGSSKGRPVLLSGVSRPGPGKKPPGGRFVLVLNPGAHVITLSRKGFTDAVLSRSYAPGARAKLDLKMKRLPATLAISANIPGAIVTVAGKDFGPAPVRVLRPAGSYQVVVSKNGYESYEARVAVQPGEESALRAKLIEEQTQITSQWWFWTGAAVILAGAGMATYALTREDEPPPPYASGSTGWVVFPTAN